jgi:hypothetical protein
LIYTVYLCYTVVRAPSFRQSIGSLFDKLYVLVPKRPLEEVVEERADTIAREQVLRVQHSMALEDQSTSKDHAERAITELRRNLLEGKRSRLWR